MSSDTPSTTENPTLMTTSINNIEKLRQHLADGHVAIGTALTFDVVDAKGAYLGGAIAPGLGLGLDALCSRTAKLPRVDLVSPGP